MQFMTQRSTHTLVCWYPPVPTKTTLLCSNFDGVVTPTYFRYFMYVFCLTVLVIYFRQIYPYTGKLSLSDGGSWNQCKEEKNKTLLRQRYPLPKKFFCGQVYNSLVIVWYMDEIQVLILRLINFITLNRSLRCWCKKKKSKHQAHDNNLPKHHTRFKTPDIEHRQPHYQMTVNQCLSRCWCKHMPNNDETKTKQIKVIALSFAQCPNIAHMAWNICSCTTTPTSPWVFNRVSTSCCLFTLHGYRALCHSCWYWAILSQPHICHTHIPHLTNRALGWNRWKQLPITKMSSKKKKRWKNTMETKQQLP